MNALAPGRHEPSVEEEEILHNSWEHGKTQYSRCARHSSQFSNLTVDQRQNHTATCRLLASSGRRSAPPGPNLLPKHRAKRENDVFGSFSLQCSGVPREEIVLSTGGAKRLRKKGAGVRVRWLSKEVSSGSWTDLPRRRRMDGLELDRKKCKGYQSKGCAP